MEPLQKEGKQAQLRTKISLQSILSLYASLQFDSSDKSWNTVTGTK